MIQAVNISKSYGDLQVLKGVSIRIAKGEVVSIVGASGAGKSTLLHILGLLDRPDGGEIIIDEKTLINISDRELSMFRNRHIGFVFQFHHLLPEFDALENVAMPLLIRGESIRTAKAEASQLLEEVGLKHRLNHKPSALSGGERQRVAIARALVTRPSCVLADEPTGNLDSYTAQHIQELMIRLNERFEISFVIVTHSHTLATIAQRTLEMVDGVLTPC